MSFWIVACLLLYCLLTSGDYSLNSSAIDESSLDCLSSDIWPVDTVLKGIIVHHSHVVDVRHSEWDDIIVVWVVNVHSSDLYLPGVQQKLPRLCRGETKAQCEKKNQELDAAWSQNWNAWEDANARFVNR